MMRALVVFLVSLITLLPIETLAAPNTAQKCEAAVDKLAARFASCRLIAQAMFAKNTDTQKLEARLLKCKNNFTKKLNRDFKRFGSDCPATETVDEFESSLIECTDAVSTAAAGGAFVMCGDNLINNTGEDCDGSDFGGVECQTFGFESGKIACTKDCKFNTSGCSFSSGTCGDNDINVSGELCDGNDLGGVSCTSLGYDSGTLKCTSECKFDTSSCTSFVGSCGDNSINAAGEHCDGNDLGSSDCTSLGFKSGTLACTSGCKFETSSCTACVSDGAPCSLGNPAACCSNTCINASPTAACGCLPKGFSCSLGNPGHAAAKPALMEHLHLNVLNECYTLNL